MYLTSPSRVDTTEGGEEKLEEKRREEIIFEEWKLFSIGWEIK